MELEEWAPGWTGALPQESHTSGYLAAVSNESDRPIRDVAAQLDVAGESTKLATRLGRLAESHHPLVSSTLKFNTFTGGSRAEVIRVGEAVGFAFPREAEASLNARASVRFTDDAGLHWQIDYDLSLTRLDHREDW